MPFSTPDCGPDPTNGRMDYFGPMVNRSARVSGAGHDGQILVSGDVMKAIGPIGDRHSVSAGQ